MRRCAGEQGWRRPLQHGDLPLLPAHLTTADGLPKFEKHWHDLLKAARSSPEVRHATLPVSWHIHLASG